MRVLCIGDSLGLPREGVPFEETWFYKIKLFFPKIEFVSFFERRLLISKALSNFDSYYTFYSSDIVVIQTGICDCSPRFIVEDKFIVQIVVKLCRRLGLLNTFWKIVKRRGRKADCVYTPILSFSDKYDELVAKFINSGVEHVIIIKIGHAAESVVKKNKFINENVDKYNKELDIIKKKYKEKVSILNPLDNLNDIYYVDGYHCNASGMDVVYNCLKTELTKYL